MPLEVKPLGFPFDALEPHIDAKTMEIHHDKHHNAYVTNLNAALEGKGLPEQSIEDLCRNIEKVPEDIRPALDRAFKSGVPACINVICDPAAEYPRSSVLM